MTCQPHNAAAVLIALAGDPHGWRILRDSIKSCPNCKETT